MTGLPVQVTLIPDDPIWAMAVEARRAQLLAGFLQVAILSAQPTPLDQLAQAADVIGSNGDSILYRTRDTAATFAVLASVIRRLAMSPGGCRFLGHRWECPPDPDETPPPGPRPVVDAVAGL